jgi:UDP-glucuronate 4-epimerase
MAGFIGFHLARRLAARGDEVVGLDNLSDYYDVALKRARLAALGPGPRFVELDLTDKVGLLALFARERFDAVVHLAAQAGVRYSLVNPDAYVSSNVVGFLHLLEACRAHPVKHLVFASSSSVYGANAKIPFSTDDRTDQPLSLYAATKKADELMAHTYAHLFGIPMTGLRFFNVYGPWGRPDSALFLFTKAILAGKPIDVFNQGEMYRDFTYVDDIVEGVSLVLDRPPTDTALPYRLYNLGRGEPVRLMEFIEILERCLAKKAVKNFLPLQPGDVASTHADTGALARDFGYRPQTTVADGIGRFVDWYRTNGSP